MKTKNIICVILYLLVSSSLIAAEIRVALSSAPNNLSPFYSTDANSQNINRLVHLSLVDFNANMQFQCVLCESFTERMEGDKHVLVFKLRSGMSFSDGAPVTVRDIVQSWKYFAKDEKINSTFKGANKW